MFEAIAPRYDAMNRLMTLGQARAWYRYAARRLKVPDHGRILDVGTGTGGIARELGRLYPTAEVVGVDFSESMMQRGKALARSGRMRWCCANALRLPFPDGTFDGVVSGYLIRNVPDPEEAFREQVRVLKAGGRLVCLDTTPVRGGWLGPLIRVYLNVVIPLLGWMVGRNQEAYTYLPQSTQAFLLPEELARVMRRGGLGQVRYRTLMLGTQAIHEGRKPLRSPF